MNQQFYQLVDNTIKSGITQSTLQYLLQNLATQQQVGTLFDLPISSEYIIKRFINACMSTDPEIRQQSAEALKKWIQASQAQPNVQKLVRFIIDSSNYKKGGNRKSQSDAFAAGRILTVKALSHIFKNNSQIFQSASQVLTDFPHLEQEAIEALHLISFDKILKLKFHSLSPQNKSSRFLYKLFLRTKDPKSQPIKLEQFKEILEIQTKEYPKKSIILYNFGKYLQTIVDVPLQFFRHYANIFLDNDSDNQVDIHEIYSILTVLKGFFDSVIITQQNYHTHFDKKIISVWLQQFRVLNKKMKSLALSMTIKFEEGNPEFAYKVLVDLHEEGVYLDNISNNHPVAKLYAEVNADVFWKYIYELCVLSEPEPIKNEENMEEEEDSSKKKGQKSNKDKQNKSLNKKPENQQTKQQQEQQEQEQKPTFYNQLQFFIKLRFKQISDEHLCKTLTLLLNKFHKNEQRKEILYLCINLENLICKIFKKKKNHGQTTEENKNKRLNKKMLLILNKLQLSELNSLTQEQISMLKKCILWGKKNTMKIRKQEGYTAHEGEIDFFNFYHCMIFFCLLYPDQIQTCHELQMAYQDLLNFYSKASQQSQLSKPKKKVKKQKKSSQENPDNDFKKPIHVLTDIFISLMTKPPAFLRKAIHYLYEDIIPFLDQNDIGNMLTVITTPDMQFIEQI